VQVTDVAHEPEEHPNAHVMVSSQLPVVHVSTLPVAPHRFEPEVHGAQIPAPVHVPPPAHATAADQS
jgi:hypothetical protein